MSEDDVFDLDIERSMRSDLGGGRSGALDPIDPDLLQAVFGPDDIESDLLSTRHSDEGFVLLKAHPDLVTDEAGREVIGGDAFTDFRDHLDQEECECRDGKVCMHCCTQSDLDGLSAAQLAAIQKINVRDVVVAGRRIVKMFDIVTKAEVATSIGWV